jgi:hypothetical protein
MKVNKFFVISIVYPLLCIFALHLFYYTSSADFAMRDWLYRALGQFFLPLYTVAGAFICIAIIIMSIVKFRANNLNLLQFLIASIFNIVSWMYIAYSYISMV